MKRPNQFFSLAFVACVAGCAPPPAATTAPAPVVATAPVKTSPAAKPDLTFSAADPAATAEWCQGWWDKINASLKNELAGDSIMESFRAELLKLKGKRVAWKFGFSQIDKAATGARMPQASAWPTSKDGYPIYVGNQDGEPPANGAKKNEWRSLVFPATDEIRKLSAGDSFILDARIVSAAAERIPNTPGADPRSWVNTTSRVYFLVDDVKVIPVFKKP